MGSHGQNARATTPRRKKPQARPAAEFPKISGYSISSNTLAAVVADGFDGAAFLGFFAAGFFVRILRLLVNERITAVVVAFEIVGRGFAAQITVDALVVHVVLSAGIFGIFICYISHKINLFR